MRERASPLSLGCCLRLRLVVRPRVMRLLAAVTATAALALPAASTAGTSDAKRAICVTFGRYCSQALRVSYCETGGTYSVYARNGQYLGLFQMGAYARARYGHSWNAWGQARAAYRYFRASGYSWRPWSCRP